MKLDWLGLRKRPTVCLACHQPIALGTPRYRVVDAELHAVCFERPGRGSQLLHWPAIGPR
jgi:hypothetical protein